MSFQHKYILLIKPIWWKLAHMCNEAVQAKKAGGLGLLRQAVEIIALRLGKCRLRRRDYYDYHLYDSQQFKWQDKKRFFGKPMENHLVSILKMERWGIVAHDKYLFNSVFDYLGFAVPAIYGVYQKIQRKVKVPFCSNREELESFLRNKISYPFVSKPTYGIYSKGVSVIAAMDYDNNEFVLANGERLDFNSYVASICEPDQRFLFNKEGFIFQEVLRPHPDIGELSGNRLCTIRFIILIESQGPEIFRALWKMPAGSNMADNFNRSGNLLAILDKNNGVIKDVVGSRERLRKSINKHPDTGKPLKGIRLPDWDKAVELCLSAATVLPELPMQAWDIAQTDNGPVLLEVNLAGGINLTQIAYNSGIYDTKLKKFLQRYGF